MSASDQRCVNCDVRLTHLRRHLLSNETVDLQTIIQSWTYPRDSTETDCICQACWELASHQLTCGNDQAHSSRHVGHHHLCVNCGRSILRARRRQVIRPNPSEEEQQMAAVISIWIQPRQLTSDDQACVPCWLRAQRASRRQQLPLMNDEPPLLEETANSSYPDDKPCINCDLEISPGAEHCITNENENLVAIIKLWTFPRQINPIDCICNSCWEMAMHQLQNTCIVCGTTTMETEAHAFDHTSEEDNQIAAIINTRIQPRQITSNEPICMACWDQAQQEMQRRYQNQLRAQRITLPNMRRVAETPRHCLFGNCNNTERNHVPDNTRRHVLVENNFYIPRGSRVCDYHLGRNNYSELYTADYSLDYFNPNQIEEMIFILTEERNDLQFGDVQRLPEHWVHYWIGITKEQHQQMLNETPRLSNMRRSSLALTALLCKMRTGDSDERLAELFPEKDIGDFNGCSKGDFDPRFCPCPFRYRPYIA